VAVINEAMARKYWPGLDPLGRRFRQGGEQRPWVTVVGVVGDVRHNGITGPVKAKFYRPYAQFHLSSGNPTRFMNLVIKASGDPLAHAVPVRAALKGLDPDVPVSNVRTMEEVVQASIAAPRFAGRLLVLFAALALTLAAVGVYGILSYTVSERAPEIGVRMALGARPGDVMKVVLTEALALAAAGVGTGALLALALTRLMRGLLYEVGPADPVSFATAALVLPTVALLAAWLPARRAAHVEPATVLRSE
jgi:putative ABC transport system permease protein